MQDSTCSGRRNIEKILNIDVLDNMVRAEKSCNLHPTHFFLTLCNRLFVDCFGQSLFDDSQHELDKNSSFPLCIRLIDCCVILGLMVMDDGFDREPCKQRIPLREQQRVPEPPDATISIRRYHIETPQENDS